MSAVTGSLFAGVLFLLLLFYRKRKRDLSLFKKMGIPGPEPHWLYGNMHQLCDPLVHIVLQKWTKEYKKLYGYYEGCRPVLVTSDLDMIHDIFIKKTSYFDGRKLTSFRVPDDSPLNHMFTARGARWKRLRTIVNPTFSSMKLKQMLPLIEEKVNKLVEKLAEVVKEGKPINMMKFYQCLTLDVIVETAFGVKVDSLNNPDEPFLINCRKIFESFAPSKRSILFTLTKVFPELETWFWCTYLLLMKIKKFPQLEVLKAMESVIRLRLKTKVNRIDLLQLMLDAKSDDSLTDDRLTMTTDDNNEQRTSEEMPSQKQLDGKTPNKKTLTIQEIKSQSFLFLVAGYETTSTALSYCTYLLSKNPHVQQKLLKEIDNYLPKETKATYDVLHQMNYLHMVLCETLRLYPLASLVVGRECSQACTVSGIHIPEGMSVQIDMWSIHHDPNIWGDDVEDFIPERFSKEAVSTHHPMAWMPFGVGPHNCIGLRFALLEAKLALAEILKRYFFEKCSETEDKLELNEVIIIIPSNGVKVKVVPRNIETKWLD